MNWFQSELEIRTLEPLWPSIIVGGDSGGVLFFWLTNSAFPNLNFDFGGLGTHELIWTSVSGLSIEANYYMWGGFAENDFKVVPILISPRSPLIYPDSDSCLESGNKSDPSRWLLNWKLSIHNCFQYTRDKQDFVTKCTECPDSGARDGAGEARPPRHHTQDPGGHGGRGHEHQLQLRGRLPRPWHLLVHGGRPEISVSSFYLIISMLGWQWSSAWSCDDQGTDNHQHPPDITNKGTQT